MKRKILSCMLITTFALSQLTACQGSSDATDTESADTGDSEQSTDFSGQTLTLFNSKSEVSEQITTLANTYGQEKGVTVTVTNAVSGADVQATLKGLYLSDQMPDIIVCESSGFANWEGLLADLSEEEWVSRTSAAYVDDEYGTLGFPYATEAIGLAYNADILEKAGINPEDLTSPSAYEEAFQTLEEKKASLGLTAVVGYCAEDENLGWSSGNHIFGNYIDSGLSRDDTTYIDMLNNGGEFDDDRLTNFAEFIGLLQQYSDPNLLVDGTYDNQVANFASGKYAFVTQGSWIGAILTGNDADMYASAGNFEVGMAPYAFEDGIDTILTNSPSWWAVVKEGNVEVAKDFLQWCSEDAGQQILVEQAGFVSPFSDCAYVASDPFASIVSQYVSNDKTSAWHWLEMKEGLGQNILAPVFNEYARGNLDTDGFVKEVKKVTKAYYNQ